MKNLSNELKNFETATEQELRDVMGGATVSNAVAAAGIALAYGIFMPSVITNKIIQAITRK